MSPGNAVRWGPWGLVAFGAGCAISNALSGPPWVLPAALLLAVLGRRIPAAPGAALLLAGLALGSARGVPCGPETPSHDPGPRGSPSSFAWVRGRVAAAEAWEGGSRVALESSSLLAPEGWRPIRGRVLAYLPVPPPLEGSTLEASLGLSLPKPATNPGEFDAAAYFAREGISLSGSARAEGLVKVAPPREWAPTARYRSALREGLLRDGGAEGGMLLALLLGERGLVAVDAEDALSRSGLYHLVALSGFNVGLVLLVLGGLAHAARIHPLRRDVLSLGVCLLYGLVVFERPSFTRALLMAGAFLLARMAGRPQPGLRGWAFAGAALLAWAPGDIRDSGFQLTFLATLGILALVRSYPEALPRVGLAGYLGRLFWVGFSAQLFTLPVLVVQFHRISFLGWLATPLASLPLLAVQGLGLLYMAGGFAVPGLSALLGAGMSASAKAFLFFPVNLGSWRFGDLFLPVPCWPWLLLFAIGLAGASLGGRRRGAGWVLAGFACLGGWAAPQPLRPPFRPGAVVLDVGQASSQVLLSGEAAVLLDAGNGNYRGLSSGRRVTEPFLAEMGLRSVAGILVTHWDRDHAGALPDLLKDVGVGFVGYPKGGGTPPGAIPDLCRRAGTPLVALARGDSLDVGAVRFSVLAPGDPPPCPGENDRSLVVRAAVGRGTVLFPGDIGPCGEADLLGSGLLAPVQVLLAPHHGSGRSSGAALLGTLSPRWVAVSSGRANRFGHPAPAALRRYAEVGAAVARTDRDGAVWVDFSGPTPTVWRFRDGDWSPRACAPRASSSALTSR